GRSRPDLNPGCPEQLPDWNFLRYVWAYPDAKLPTVLALLREHGAHKRVVVLCSSAEVHRFLSAIRAFVGSGAVRQPPNADT
ncbi:MAG TPA: hypothetical protein VK358_03345, partial [Longimicrobium sp.]|nr:hypothetical protein [Longimicrobium sp.]